MKLLLTGMGGPAGICFAKALEGYKYTLIGADASDSSIGNKLVSRMYRLPMANDPDYLEKLNEIIDIEKIDVLIPLVDEELPIVSKNIVKINCKVMISPYETIQFTSDKLKAYEKLSKFLPKSYKLTDDIQYPVFVKPKIGRGGKDTHLVHSLIELQNFDPKDYVYQTVLSEPEVTVDCSFSSKGVLLTHAPRVRTEVKSAISTSGITFEDKYFIQTITSISKILRFVGPVNFQFMTFNGKYVLTEINARSSGGMGITVNSGVNIPHISISSFAENLTINFNRTLGLFSNFDEILERQNIKLLDV